MQIKRLLPVAYLASLILWTSAPPGFAGDLQSRLAGDGGPARPAMEGSSSRCPQNADGTFCWMSPDVGAAWASGYNGSGVSVTIIDNFTGNMGQVGDLGHGSQWRRHGQWVAQAAGMVAPGANIAELDYSEQVPLTLKQGLNVINLSYGLDEPVSEYRLEQSIVDAARAGAAVFTKAAGNGSVAVDTLADGDIDFLALDLIGKQSAIFVGALERNGAPENKAKLASYSNYAGSDSEVQNHFLTVGVESDKTGLPGTSVAASVVAGYAAILGSKFTSATPTQITNQLLDTARTDTLINYDAATYGHGEASLSRALAPVSIR